MSVAIANRFPLSTPAPWSLAAKPATPDSRDEEFEGTAFSAWTQGVAPQATAIDPYAAIVVANHWRCSWNTLRSSYLMVQVTTGGMASALIHKAVAVGANDFVYARVAWPRRNYGNGSSLQNDGQFLLRVSATAAGVPDGNNSIHIGFTSGAANGSFIQYRTTSGGVASNTDLPIAADLLQTHSRVEYIGMHKVGTSIHFYVAGADGAWVPLGTKTYTGSALDRVSILANNATSTFPGNAIVGVDYIRFLSTASQLP